MDSMNWLNLENLLLEPSKDRVLTQEPALDHAQFCEQALRLAAGLQARNIKRLAVHLEDAGDLSIALLGAWRAGAEVLLPADLQGQTRQRWAKHVDMWLTDQVDDTRPQQLQDIAALAPMALDLDECRLSLCTSGSSGEPKLIEKRLRQLTNEVQALEQADEHRIPTQQKRAVQQAQQQAERNRRCRHGQRACPSFARQCAYQPQAAQQQGELPGREMLRAPVHGKRVEHTDQ